MTSPEKAGHCRGNASSDPLIVGGAFLMRRTPLRAIAPSYSAVLRATIRMATPSTGGLAINRCQVRTSTLFITMPPPHRVLRHTNRFSGGPNAWTGPGKGWRLWTFTQEFFLIWRINSISTAWPTRRVTINPAILPPCGHTAMNEPSISSKRCQQSSSSRAVLASVSAVSETAISPCGHPKLLANEANA
jgi:hypothetical protein